MLPPEIWPPSGLRIRAGTLELRPMDEQVISDAVRAVSRVDDVFADPTGPEVFHGSVRRSIPTLRFT